MTFGHKWEALDSVLFNSTRTARSALSNASQSRLSGVRNLDALAKSFDGECFSKEFFGRKLPLRNAYESVGYLLDSYPKHGVR